MRILSFIRPSITTARTATTGSFYQRKLISLPFTTAVGISYVAQKDIVRYVYSGDGVLDLEWLEIAKSRTMETTHGRFERRNDRALEDTG